jgi:CubicO group peptidase (beta-lactamase class C family)
LSSIGAGLVAFSDACIAIPATGPIRDALEKTVGAREKVAGTIAVVIDQSGINMVTRGSSGVRNVALDTQAVFEIGSNTKVLTSLMLTDMAARGEVALDDPVVKYLPPTVTLRERGRPITLLDLANYNSGLPMMPGNLPPNWSASLTPFADYTEDKLYEFLTGYMPEYEPGAHFVYSSLGFALLGAALARRAGKSYEELLIERVCDPLGLAHTRVSLSADMQKHLVQPHDIAAKPIPIWDLGALQGAGGVRSNANDMTMFLKACMGLVRTPLNSSLARLLGTRRPTGIPGTDAALGWFISSDRNEEIVWKTGLTGGCNTFIGFSTRNRRGALVLSNFIWQPLDVGTTAMGMKFINPDFGPGDLTRLYQ